MGGKLLALFAFLACAASSSLDPEKAVKQFSRLLEEDSDTPCCNCVCGSSGQCGIGCSSCNCAGCCPTEEEAAAAAEAEHEAEEVAEEKEHEKEEEGAVKFGFVIGLMALAGTFIFGYILEHHEINWLPEAGVGVIMGILASAITTYGGFKMIKAHEQVTSSARHMTCTHHIPT